MAHSLKSLITILPQCGVKIETNCKSSVEQFSNLLDAIRKKIAALFVPEDDVKSLNGFFDDYVKEYKKILDNDYSLNIKLNKVSVESAFSYLESIRKLFRFFFSLEKLNPYSKLKDIIQLIVNSDIKSCDNETIEIGISNPIVLESMLICYLQLHDLEELKSRLDSNETLITLYTELLQAKAERLFKDIIILFDGAFYRIRGVKYKVASSNEITGIKFVAEKEDNLSSIEVIAATRMFEKIVVGLDKEKEYRVLLIGEVMNIGEVGDEPSTLSDLKKMIKEYGCKVAVDYITKEREDFSAIFSPNMLKEIAEKYDKVFVLDCPEIYYPIALDQKSDELSVMYRSQADITELLGNNKETGERDFFNKNGFAAIYYRVQNYLCDFTRKNLKKTRKINTDILYWFKEVYPYNDRKHIDEFEKQAYVYISNNSDFVNDLYDRFNFVRVERYNSKDCRIVKYPEPPLPPRNKIVSNGRKLSITLYKLLKMLSSDIEFYNKILGLKEKSYKEIFDISKNVEIGIQYSPIIEHKIYLNITSRFPYGTPESVENATEHLVREMFDFSGRNLQNKIMLYCYKKAVANVFSGCVENFNDCLFHHFYMKKLLSVYKHYDKAEISFKINSYIIDAFDLQENPYAVKEIAFQYSIKRVAYDMLERLDASYCDNKDIIQQYTNARINRENINMYIVGLMNACDVFDYKDSSLFKRLSERF
ncbi:MAG: hypothetical protein J1F18_05720 [Lachnospiraceae bacterium]|nr:hypothetical protein [Lachnospiraceae bacterium]